MNEVEPLAIKNKPRQASRRMTARVAVDYIERRAGCRASALPISGVRKQAPSTS